MHGWPHLFSLQLDFADLLPDFHVVVPAFPGFAFSSPYAEGPITEIAARRHDARAHDRGARLRPLPHVRRGRLGQRERSDRRHVSGCRRRHPRDARALPVAPTSDARLHRPEERAFFERLVRAARDRRRVRPRPGHAPRHAGGGAQRLARRAARLAGREARRVERHARRRSAGCRAAHLARADPHRGDDLLGHPDASAPRSGPTTRAPTRPAPIPPVDGAGGACSSSATRRDYPESLARDFYRDLRVFERLDEGGHFAVAEVPAAMADARPGVRSSELGLL